MERLPLGLLFVTAIEIPKLKTVNTFCYSQRRIKSDGNFKKLTVSEAQAGKLQGGETR